MMKRICLLKGKSEINVNQHPTWIYKDHDYCREGGVSMDDKGGSLCLTKAPERSDTMNLYKLSNDAKHLIPAEIYTYNKDWIVILTKRDS